MARPAVRPVSQSFPNAEPRRRKQRVVVRAPESASAPLLIGGQGERRRRCPTLPGLGFIGEHETTPLLDEEVVFLDDPTPHSHVRAKVAPKPLAVPSDRDSPDHSPRSRPVTLLDDVHDSLSQRYLEEARRLIANGVFDEG